MNLGLDRHADLDSPLHRWDPRCKLAGLVALIFALSFVQDLRLLPVVLGIALILYAVSRMPASALLARLRAPGLFLLATALLLPFFSGSTVLWRVGPVAVRREGCLALLSILVRFSSIVTVGLVLFGTAPFATTVRAMRALGLPAVLVDMTFLSYRYLHEIGDDLHVSETAMRLRGFRLRRLDGRALGVLASLVGTLLVRSYERSERVYKAMVLRGYGRAPRREDAFRATGGDRVALAGVLLLGAGVVAAQVLLQGSGG